MLADGHRVVHPETLGRLDNRGGVKNTAKTKKRPRSESDMSLCLEVGRTSSRAFDGQEVLFDQQVIGDDCLRATRPEELGDRHRQMGEEFQYCLPSNAG